MKITIGSTELVSGQTRNSTGSPIGPDNLVIDDRPGIVIREYVGKTRIEPEDVKPHHGSASFGVTRTFASVAAALTYMSTTLLGEETEGALKFDSNVVFSKATVSNRKAANVGCTVVVNYTIEG